jgi:putative transposase
MPWFEGWVVGRVEVDQIGSTNAPQSNLRWYPCLRNAKTIVLYNLLMQYRRVLVPGGTHFFTVVTYQRRPLLESPESVENLRSAFRKIITTHPFTIVASVILPDHMHFIWSLPEGDKDYPTRWRLIKSHFTRNFSSHSRVSGNSSRIRKGEQDVWQRRYWEHLIRDENDLARHIEYIHYNPVKHGLAQSPAEWPYSSFSKYVKEGHYSEDWGRNVEVWGGQGGME